MGCAFKLIYVPAMGQDHIGATAILLRIISRAGLGPKLNGDPLRLAPLQHQPVNRYRRLLDKPLEFQQLLRQACRVAL